MPSAIKPIFDALKAAQARDLMPTTLGTAELRELGAGMLARSVFTARGANALFAAQIQEVINAIAAGDLSDGQARTALKETLLALGYTPEDGFPDGEPVPEALAGTLQDLSSFRRLDLIVRTQRELMQGAGQKARGQMPDQLQQYPAWELIRRGEVRVSREWDSRWVIAGGKTTPNGLAYQNLGQPTGMIALKGDPVWGELGAWENFSDALGVDHPPFCFNSGMGWREVPIERVKELGITGPDGETPDEWFASRPITMSGQMALPTPRMSLDSVPAELLKPFQAATHATPVTAAPGKFDFSDLLAEEITKHDAAYAARNAGGDQ